MRIQWDVPTLTLTITPDSDCEVEQIGAVVLRRMVAFHTCSIEQGAMSVRCADIIEFIRLRCWLHGVNEMCLAVAHAHHRGNFPDMLPES